MDVRSPAAVLQIVKVVTEGHYLFMCCHVQQSNSLERVLPLGFQSLNSLNEMSPVSAYKCRF